VIDQIEYTVMVTLESLDRETLNAASENLLKSIPDEKLIRVE
jgi:hypothetical protein